MQMQEGETLNWPAGCGEMQTRIRDHDWSTTPLGPIAGWPPFLKTTVDLLLGMPVAGEILWGEEGIMLYNDAFSAFAGKLHPALLGSKVRQSIPSQEQFHAEVMSTVLAGGSLVFRDRKIVLHRDGRDSTAWLDLDFSPVLDEQGHAAAVFGLVTETSARVRTERALQESEARMSAIFARAAVGLSELSVEGAFLRVNDELCTMLGRSRDALLAMGIAEVTHPEDLGKSLVEFGRILDTGQPASINKRYLRSDGKLVWARSSLSRLEHAGAPYTVLAVTVDLTERLHAEQALAESEARFRALAEAAPVLIWQLSPDGDAVYLNPRCVELTGAPTDTLKGRGWHDFVHPEDRDVFVSAIADAQRRRVNVRQRVRLRDRNGAWHWFESHSAPWYADGTYQGHVGISLDISDEVRTREELLISNERLNLAIEGSGDGIWDWDITTNRLVYSKRLKEMLGFAESDSFECYADWEQRVHPEDLPAALTALEECLGGIKPSYVSEHRLRCKNGRYNWVMARAIVVTRDAQGRPMRMTGTITDISEKRRSEEVIWRHANFDTLTGLPNRRLFRDRLEHEVRKAQRTGLPVALLFIDLDHFKEANDLLGHDIGDLLLTEAGKRICACVRKSDTVARLGGDEFTAILADLEDVAHVETVAQKMIDALATPFRLADEVVYLSASIGITLHPTDAVSPEDLLRNADQAMYAAKGAGRNQFSYFTQSMQREAHARSRLISDLRNAIDGNQLRVHFQPVVDLATGRVTKAEALVRWAHPALGLIDPPVFIQLAEESGLISEIGEWVFRQAAERSREWGKRLGKPFQISVNKSAVQFLPRAEESNWSGYLRSLGLSGSSISVEIPEGVLLNASDCVSGKLQQYREAGIQVALDDFGTGYSSMAYLRKFGIDYLKIDQSFVHDIDSGGRVIVRSIIAMAHELGLQVIAEGIETEAQRHALIAAGCDFGQGFLFSPPLPAEEFADLIGH